MSNAAHFCEKVGLNLFAPVIRLAWGDDIPTQLREISRQILIPLVSILVFLWLWGTLAAQVNTSLGTLPGPAQVWQATQGLYADHLAEQQRARDFYDRQVERNRQRLAENPQAEVRIRPYVGQSTFFDQILTSLQTVFTAFLLASAVAIPLGILCGLSPWAMAALNPLIQIFKPVSPLAWLPIVTLVVSAVYATEGWFARSFLISAITVMLCSLWPTLINTALGVSSLDRDLLNVAKVLRLNWFTQIWKIVLPASLPLIFTGLRLSLGVGWMVLIAAEMLAQNPGLGKFVWDEFQNGSSDSLSRIMVAVIVIGLVGFFLDRLMFTLEKLVSHERR